MKKNQNARLIVRYFDAYKLYLQENNLDDDSNSIDVDSLIQFMEDYLNPDETEYLLQQIKF